MPFEFEPTDISDVIVITPKVFHDERGFFLESYNRRSLVSLGIVYEFVQDNHSRSARGVLRVRVQAWKRGNGVGSCLECSNIQALTARIEVEER